MFPVSLQIVPLEQNTTAASQVRLNELTVFPHFCLPSSYQVHERMPASSTTRLWHPFWLFPVILHVENWSWTTDKESLALWPYLRVMCNSFMQQKMYFFAKQKDSKTERKHSLRDKYYSGSFSWSDLEVTQTRHIAAHFQIHSSSPWSGSRLLKGKFVLNL